jgi:hypothetical protein
MVPPRIAWISAHLFSFPVTNVRVIPALLSLHLIYYIKELNDMAEGSLGEALELVDEQIRNLRTCTIMSNI